MSIFPKKISNLVINGVSSIDICKWRELLDYYDENHEKLSNREKQILKNLNLQIIEHYNTPQYTAEVTHHEGKEPKVIIIKKPENFFKLEELMPNAIWRK